ncbi:MAG: LysR family transcriptional regulator, partial [Pyramidobacter sp.]|nr:LysR family transcriptional regulator [Pyramidobacter sp.]
MQNELRYIDMVYQKGSFSKAARALYVTQPALSIAIQKIENEIGMPLFDRSQKPLRLTEAGRIYIEKIRQMERLENELHNQLLDLTSMLSGSVRIGATSYIISCVLPPVLNRFRELHPGVRLEIAEAGSYELKEMLRDQRIDITFLSVPEKDSPFSVTPAFTDQLLLAVPAGFAVNARLKGCALTAAQVRHGV